MKSSLNLQMIVLAFVTPLISFPSSASSSPPPSQPKYSSSSFSPSSLVSTPTRTISTHHQQPKKTEIRRLHRQNWTRPPPLQDEGQQHEWRQRRRDLRAFKAALLRILGLASEPRPPKAGGGHRRMMIPGYMWELYERMAKGNRENNAVKRPTKVTKRDGKRPPFDADTVRCFEAVDAGRKTPFHIPQPLKQVLLFFYK